MGRIKLDGPIGEWVEREAAAGNILWIFPLDHGFCLVVAQDGTEGLWQGRLRSWMGADHMLDGTTHALVAISKNRTRNAAVEYLNGLAEIAKIKYQDEEPTMPGRRKP